ncbi:MAG: hypothetical protein IJ667_01120, partial [Synergistaceae bacterium]|nr:hypothetical protein [Synergistaceae bacterium]
IAAGFASKLSLTMAAFESRAIIWALAALAASSVLNALYYVPAMIVMLTPAKAGAAKLAAPVSLSFKLSMSAFDERILSFKFYIRLVIHADIKAD